MNAKKRTVCIIASALLLLSAAAPILTYAEDEHDWTVYFSELYINIGGRPVTIEMPYNVYIDETEADVYNVTVDLIDKQIEIDGVQYLINIDEDNIYWLWQHNGVTRTDDLSSEITIIPDDEYLKFEIEYSYLGSGVYDPDNILSQIVEVVSDVQNGVYMIDEFAVLQPKFGLYVYYTKKETTLDDISQQLDDLIDGPPVTPSGPPEGELGYPTIPEYTSFPEIETVDYDSEDTIDSLKDKIDGLPFPTLTETQINSAKQTVRQAGTYFFNVADTVEYTENITEIGSVFYEDRSPLFYSMVILPIVVVIIVALFKKSED